MTGQIDFQLWDLKKLIYLPSFLALGLDYFLTTTQIHVILQIFPSTSDPPPLASVLFFSSKRLFILLIKAKVLS